MSFQSIETEVTETAGRSGPTNREEEEMLGFIGTLHVVKTWNPDAAARMRTRGAVTTMPAGPASPAGPTRSWCDDDIR